MLLSDLLGRDCSAPPGMDAMTVTDVTADSRAVELGSLFIALPGGKADGANYVPQAIAKGAVAVVVGRTVVIDVPPGIALIRVDDPRRALALMASRFYAGQPEWAVAVTGTSGKTSVAEFTRQILRALGRRSASVGTLGVVRPDGSGYGSLTTPDPVTLHKTLAALKGENVTHLAFEASSHGLDQRRLDGVRLSAGAFTNLGRDHMDYHATVDDYFSAKMRLFRALLAPGQPAVINANGAFASEARAVAVARGLDVLTVGTTGETLRLDRAARDGFAQRLAIMHRGKTYDIRLPLVGAYQVENALVAAGLAIATGEPADGVLGALETLTGVPGRLEIVGVARGGLAVVDYAHKPEALIAVLDALRPFATGRLICVFGCGGDRDRGKRPVMGQIAMANADVVIVTDDNPRSEVPARIRAEILTAASGATEIGDRGEAIAAAVAMMRPGDVVVVAGKGHETGQIVGDRTLPFSDHDALRSALERA